MRPTRASALAAGAPGPAARLGRGPLLAIAAVLLLSGCSWHRIEPRLDRAPAGAAGPAVGVAAEDGETSLSDLAQIAKRWAEWGAFERVQFPFRDGDPVDLVVRVRLRQHADAHTGANVLKAVAVGLSLFTLSPVLGPRITERHEVSLRCVRGADAIGPIPLRVSTDAVFGAAADVGVVARDLDDEQLKRLAAAALEAIRSQCLRPGAPGR